MNKLVDLPELSKEVTPIGLKSKEVYNWYYFPHSFSPDLIDFLLERYKKLKEGYRLLDPFSGSGTSVLRAVELGLDAVGVDIMPLSIHIGTAKTESYDLEKLKDISERIFAATSTNIDYETDLSFVDKIFDKKVANDIASLSIVLKTQDEYKSFFITWLAKLADEASGATKSGGFTRNYSSKNKRSNRSHKINSPKSSEEILPLGMSIFNNMLASANSVRILGKAKFYLGDARYADKLLDEEESFDIVITSPPYPNRQDYTRIFAAELFATYSFLSHDHKLLRYSSLRSHLEARNPGSYLHDIPEQLKELVSINIDKLMKDHLEFEEIKAKHSPSYVKKPIDARIPKMIRGYFEDMYLFITSSSKKIKVGSEICIIVANVRHSGSVIECDSILAEIGKIAGLTHVETLVARTKGNSSQQMKYLERVPLRESIVVLRRKYD